MGNNKNPRVPFDCEYCGKLSSDRSSHYIRKKRHFCSMECYAKFRKEIRPKEEHERWQSQHEQQHGQRIIGFAAQVG